MYDLLSNQLVFRTVYFHESRSIKFIYSEKATKICEKFNSHVLCCASKNLGEDFAKFCGLLRIYERRECRSKWQSHFYFPLLRMIPSYLVWNHFIASSLLSRCLHPRRPGLRFLCPTFMPFEKNEKIKSSATFSRFF
jgi:hypothetical protein